MERTKTEIVLISLHQTGSKSMPLEIYMNEQSITENEYSDVSLDESLPFNEHLNKTFKKILLRAKLL